MLRHETHEDAAFRSQVRSWLEAELPQDLRHLTFRPQPARAMDWYRALSRRGWIAPHWPSSHGGMGASPLHQLILMEELARAGAPDLPTQGLNHLGPILIRCGTSQQQAQHLPRILAGEVIWCQGYSERGAGSDLASISTRAEPLPDGGLRLHGHKIWTTWGHHAQWMFALVRTSREPAKQAGLTFVLIDLGLPGIERRPIMTIAGDEEFCEVFLDGVEIPGSAIVGTPGEGWSVANAVLDEERLRIGAPLAALHARQRLRRICASGFCHAPDPAALLSRADAAVDVLEAAYLSLAEAQDPAAGRNGSWLKLLATSTVHHVLDLATQAAGPLAAVRGAIDNPSLGRVDLTEMVLQSRRLGIYGGSSQMQRQILATRTLGLPVTGKARDALPYAPAWRGQDPLTDSVRRFCAAMVDPARMRLPAPGDARLWEAIVEQGWVGMLVSEERGGLGQNASAFAALAEACGGSLLQAPVVAALVAAWQLSNHGDQALLDEILGGASVVLTGSPRRSGDGIVACGVVQREIASSILVQAGCGDDDWRLVDAAITANDNDFRLVDGNLLSLLDLPAGRFDTAARIPFHPGSLAPSASPVDLLRLGTAAMLLGTATTALGRALDYLHERRQFGQPIGTFQALQHRAADCHVALATTASMINEAARACDTPGNGNTRRACALAHGLAIDTATFVTRESVQFHGAMGYADEHDAGLYLKSAMALSAREERDEQAPVAMACWSFLGTS